MKIWHKILVAPGVAIAFLAVLGAVAFLMLRQQHDSLDGLVTQRMARFETAADAARDMAQVHSGVYRLMTWMANYDEARIKSSLEGLRKQIDEVSGGLAKLGAGDLGADERRLVESVQPLLAKYRSTVEKGVDLGTVDIAIGLMSLQNADTQFQTVVRDLEELVALEQRLARENYEAAGVAYERTLLVLGALVAAAVAAALLVALKMSRSIVRPLNTAIATANRIAEGDLTVKVRATGTDESAQLLRAVAAMNDGLRKLVGEVSSGARMVADTSTQIAHGNVDLSQRTEEQASTLEETASSMEELTSSVTQNAHNARQASELARGAADVARKGGSVVGEVVSTMDGISASSRKISEIIGVIDGIAFQTNILALNAAVEAARAGEQGRGFAVVAGEVRQLAQRSAEAARQIKGLIGDSVTKVDAGNKLVDTAGKTMNEIVAAVTRVSDLIADIAAASQEQSSGIEQVNTAVTQMDQVVQQNASLVEESTAATEAMKEQAGTLLQLVARFRLGEDEAPAAPVERARPAQPVMPSIQVRRPAAEPLAMPAAPIAQAHAQAPRNGAGWQEF
ncbi:MAG TPA: methyl-accepting chemotaxis protein [Ramlibacter sp.]|uniref:methyl-accepting chemotaxis protein n=1 Tax=Ramlibacter sp. TaxID=1917967 RepID=UPI002D8086E9|nr:methyl-accepting chemotaxis protein [Ramlibacter sp.]HET8748224.1 methyl-accepting chemotaxis protein [Ramlibacter sp.]